MTTTQKISWINDKISTIIKEKKELNQKNSEMKEVSFQETTQLKNELEQWKNKAQKKDEEIQDLKIQLKQRESEIDDVVAKIDLLINS